MEWLDSSHQQKIATPTKNLGSDGKRDIVHQSTALDLHCCHGHRFDEFLVFVLKLGTSWRRQTSYGNLMEYMGGYDGNNPTINNHRNPKIVIINDVKIAIFFIAEFSRWVTLQLRTPRKCSAKFTKFHGKTDGFSTKVIGKWWIFHLVLEGTYFGYWGMGQNWGAKCKLYDSMVPWASKIDPSPFRAYGSPMMQVWRCQHS